MKKSKYLAHILIYVFGIMLIVAQWDLIVLIFSSAVEKITTTQMERDLENDNNEVNRRPNNPWVYSYRGDTYKEYKEYDAALNDYLKAYELDKSFGSSVFSDISNVYLAKGDTENAFKYINLLLPIAPAPKNFAFDVAIIYDYQYESIKAVEAYSTFINEANDVFKKKKQYALKRRLFHNFLLKKYDVVNEDINTVLEKTPDDKEAVYFKSLLADPAKIDVEKLKEKFAIDVHTAIVGIGYF